MNVDLIARLAMVLLKQGPTSAGDLQHCLLVDPDQLSAVLLEARRAGVRIEECVQNGIPLYRLPYAAQRPRLIRTGGAS